MMQVGDFITKYCRLCEEDLALVLSNVQFRTVRKGSHILKPGQTCTQLNILLEGRLRIYLNDSNERQITAWIALENTYAMDTLSFYSQTPSNFYIQAISDCRIATISYHDLQLLYTKLPQFQEFGRRLAEDVAVQAVSRAISFQKETAEKRYEQIIKKPEYMQNVLLKHLASFLGLTDTSLSRLRRRKN
jgi:CRP/FNR family transcriptional regulator, anaerobic regulatory protein